MWNLIGRRITVNLTDGQTTFDGRVRWSWSWRTVVLDQAYLIAGERRIMVDGRVRIPVGSVLFTQVTDSRRAEVGA